MIKIMRAKLHGLTVTGAELDYHGSITLDPEICEKAGIFPLEFVDIWNKSSGARITTYVIYGQPGSRCCILNGAAARTCQTGDQVIICASTHITEPSEIYRTHPTILTFGADNQIQEQMHYEVKKTATRDFDFSVHSSWNHAQSERTLHTVNITALSNDLKTQGLSDLAISDFISKHLGQCV